MNKKILKLKSYAKINLYLNIGQKFEDGYHKIESIMQTIDLFDEIYLMEINSPGIFIECNNKDVPIGKDSIVYKSAQLLMQNLDKGVRIFIKKNIPLASGLGGGSSNVATILIGICKLFNLKSDFTQLINIAKKFGTDIPFFLFRGTAFVSGRGDNILPLKPISPSLPILLVNPGIKISTKWAYHLFDQQLVKHNTQKVIDINHFINKKEVITPLEIYSVIYNSFQIMLCNEFSVIKNILNQLKNLGAMAVCVTGSGATVYGIFKNIKENYYVYQKIKNKYPFVYNTTTVAAQEIFS